MLKADNIASVQQYFLAVGIAVCLILVLIVRFFQLQILDYDQYSKKANTNRIRKVTTSAPRGLILDRNGQILVDNLPTYIINAVPGNCLTKIQPYYLYRKLLELIQPVCIKTIKILSWQIYTDQIGKRFNV
ncbi:MAG: hypothetical protein CM15mP87_04910 [Candidatus Neomarinimicrobiota bacterium]|nr:MAG: hypothetical protein CM15mP87_04910 [Candidatus Neomarinimicrobiota bacterium]